MHNIFLEDFYTRLRAWSNLKETLKEQNADLKTICIEVDKFWQWAPLSAHYLHPDEIEKWPNPWELINDNNYCYYARALGIMYTLMLLGITDLDFVIATDYTSEDTVLVLVDDAKYVLNYLPNSVVNNASNNFKITKRIDINSLYTKIGLNNEN